MNLKGLIIIAVAAFCAVSANSCKKDSDDSVTTSKSFTGTLSVDVPSFIEKGTLLKLKPAGMEKDTVTVRYYWTASPLSTDKDTTDIYELQLKDTLCTVTVSCTAFASGYTSQTVSSYCVLVDPAIGGSVVSDGLDSETLSLNDPRDARPFYYANLGSKDWFVKNLQWSGAGRSFQGCDVMDSVYGRYYTWNEAQTACPEGWRLPTDDDWLDLATASGYTGTVADETFLGAAGAFMVDARFNLYKMWEYWPDVKITNKTGFCSIPTGYGIDDEAETFTGDFEWAVYWSAESVESEDGEGLGVYRMINVNKPDLVRGALSKDGFLASVRCVRD